MSVSECVCMCVRVYVMFMVRAVDCEIAVQNSLYI